ncbi:MAG: hypothetical protein JNG84_14485 [Archangium sp.]|nr:hypothetical protein [Archangium sp.]
MLRVMTIRATALCVVLSVLSGCPNTIEPPPPPPAKLKTTYRVLSGASMGAIGATSLGMTHPDQVDAVAGLGGPLDAAFFNHMLDEFMMTGFCTREQLEAQLEADPSKLNDPAVIDQCARIATPGTKFELPNDFNHWHVTLQGGGFFRDTYWRMLNDLSLAFGNMMTENPASAFAPPGVDPQSVRVFAPDFCTNPTRVRQLYNDEYNPEGKYDAITFCDGEPTLFFCANTKERVNFCSDPANILNPLPVDQERAFADQYCQTKGGALVADEDNHGLYWLDHAGYRDPCRQPTKAQGMMLAFDYNRNGRRDYGEPVVNNSRERWSDVGIDGCANTSEDGKGGCLAAPSSSGGDPNRDDYDTDTNPTGTERDWIWEPGEPYRDLGLDGVANTNDVGEGNGQYDMSTGRQSLTKYDVRTNYRAMDDAGRARLSVFVEGGVRDVFNLGLQGKHAYGGIKGVSPLPVGEYRQFVDLPGMLDRRRNAFNPWNNRWGLVPRNLLMFYGVEDATDQQRVDGDGDHVGTAEQAVNRFSVLFNWSAQTWPTLERPVTELGGTSASERQRVEWYQSAVLGAKWEYSVALPPGYDDPRNADKRYPVVYLLHGYGMEPEDFMATALVTDAYVTDTDVKFRPMIFVFPNGRCCWLKADGQRDCRENDDQGRNIDEGQGWVRECESGTFYVNRKGYTPNDQTRYGDAMFELFEHIDGKFRTMRPAEVEAR